MGCWLRVPRPTPHFSVKLFECDIVMLEKMAWRNSAGYFYFMG